MGGFQEFRGLPRVRAVLRARQCRQNHEREGQQKDNDGDGVYYLALMLVLSGIVLGFTIVWVLGFIFQNKKPVAAARLQTIIFP